MYRRKEFDAEIHKGKMIEGTKIMWNKAWKRKFGYKESMG